MGSHSAVQNGSRISQEIPRGLDLQFHDLAGCRGSVGQLWTCAVVHHSARHICNNLSSIVPNLVKMEEKFGSVRLGLELGTMTGVAGALFGEQVIIIISNKKRKRKGKRASVRREN